MDKQAYADKLEAQIDEWKAEMAKLRARVDQADADARIEKSKAIDNAQVKVRELESRLTMLKSANEEAWEEIKDGLQSAYDTVKKAISDATSA